MACRGVLDKPLEINFVLLGTSLHRRLNAEQLFAEVYEPFFVPTLFTISCYTNTHNDTMISLSLSGDGCTAPTRPPPPKDLSSLFTSVSMFCHATIVRLQVDEKDECLPLACLPCSHSLVSLLVFTSLPTWNCFHHALSSQPMRLSTRLHRPNHLSLSSLHTN